MDNLEYYLSSGLSSGRPAALIGQDIRQLLNEPNRRFRRVRDANGKLVPSQPMKDYHPGQGVYRSSYKNALRLAVTKTNKAFRTADYERWQNMDFVTGIEVERRRRITGRVLCVMPRLANIRKISSLPDGIRTVYVWLHRL